MTSISTADIDKRLAAIAAKNTSLGFEAEELALASVSGDATANDRLAEVRRQIAANLAEADTLELAKAEAGRLEQSSREKLSLAHRKKQLQTAQTCAAEMQGLASELDRLHREFFHAYDRMVTLERQIKPPLSHLGLSTEGRTGQGELAHIAVAQFSAIEKPSYEQGWSVAKSFDVAWGHIAGLEIE